MEARRFEAAHMFARGVSQAAVARALGVSTAATNYWHTTWAARGLRGLKAARRVGRRPRLGPEQLTAIKRALRAGPRAYGYRTDLWTLRLVARVINQLTDVSYHPGHTWRILRKLGWSVERSDGGKGQGANARARSSRRRKHAVGEQQ